MPQCNYVLIKLPNFVPNSVNKKKSRKCKKQGIKNFLFLYYIQAKCGNIADKIPNVADNNKQTFNYRWPNNKETELGSRGEKVSPSVSRNTGVVLVPCHTWKCVPTAISGGNR